MTHRLHPCASECCFPSTFTTLPQQLPICGLPHKCSTFFPYFPTTVISGNRKLTSYLSSVSGPRIIKLRFSKSALFRNMVAHSIPHIFAGAPLFEAPSLVSSVSYVSYSILDPMKRQGTVSNRHRFEMQSDHHRYEYLVMMLTFTRFSQHAFHFSLCLFAA